jgi:hypothetical protein
MGARPSFREMLTWRKTMAPKKKKPTRSRAELGGIGPTKKKYAPAAAKPPRKPLCGECGNRGHNVRTCPLAKARGRR